MLGLGVAAAPPPPLVLVVGPRRPSSRAPPLFFFSNKKSLRLPFFSRPSNKSYKPPLLRSGPDADADAELQDDGFEIEVERVDGKKNGRRIRSQITVDAHLQVVWSVLTNYEGLADFITGLAVSQLLDKSGSFARLYQVGQQELALGLKLDAKGVLDCYEGDLESLPNGATRRNIDFRMVEGDFRTFEGRWSIEQINSENRESLEGQKFQTTLSYIVELEPKLWLPVRLLEGRLRREVKTNLVCVREEAERIQRVGSVALPT